MRTNENTDQVGLVLAGTAALFSIKIMVVL